MNPWHLSATGLLVWGLVVHLVADWPLQNDWMARHKTLRRPEPNLRNLSEFDRGTVWWDRHPAALVHAGIHGALLAVVFGWVAAPLALAHLIIDTRVPVAWWSRLVRQTQPSGEYVLPAVPPGRQDPLPLYDIGVEVRFWTDQVFHIVCLALAALAVGAA